MVGVGGPCSWLQGGGDEEEEGAEVTQGALRMPAALTCGDSVHAVKYINTRTACSITVKRLLRLVTPDWRIKCFWAWDATCVGVRDGT